jgi:hypothetical protein
MAYIWPPLELKLGPGYVLLAEVCPWLYEIEREKEKKIN